MKRRSTISCSFGFRLRLADEFVVIGVSADPEPEETVRGFDGEGSVMLHPDPRGPEPIELLEVKRRVSGSALSRENDLSASS